MYKTRLAQWQLAKHNRSSDMAFVLRKKKQHDALGKRCNFVIRGKAVTSQQADRYFCEQRKANRAIEEAPLDVPTPAHVQCSSDLDGDPHPDTDDNNVIGSNLSDSATRKLKRRIIPHHLGTGNKNKLPPRQAYRTIKMKASSPTLLRTLASPDIFLQPERLFTIIPVYVSSFIASVTTWTSRDGKFSTHNNDTINPLPFYHFSRKATGKFKSGNSLQGRVLLSKAFALLPQMLRKANPHTFYVLLDTFLWLRKEGFVGIYALMQDYIAQLARAMLPAKDLCQEIWLKLSVHDPEQVDLVEQTQRCIWDALSRVYKWFSRSDTSSKSIHLISGNDYQDFIGLHGRTFGHLKRFRLVNEGLNNVALFISHELASSLASQGQHKRAVMLLSETLTQANLACSVSRTFEEDLMQTVAVALSEFVDGTQGASMSMCYEDSTSWISTVVQQVHQI